MNVSLAKKILALFFFSSSVVSAAAELEQSIELSAIATYSHFNSSDAFPEWLLPEEELIARLDAYWNAIVYFTDDVQASLRYGLSNQNRLYVTPQDSSSFSIGQGGADYRWRDLDAELWSSSDDDIRLLQQLDLLSVSYFRQASTVTVGRQAISFGAARVFSPVDVLQPLNLLATDASYRPGVDAVRANWYLGAVTEFDAGFVFGADQALFLRAKTFMNNLDWEATAIHINGQASILGVSTTGGLGAVGLWQESAFLFADDDIFLRSSIGVDTTVLDDLYIFSELHYNGVGNANNYFANSENRFYQLGAVVPQAKWYASVDGRYSVNPLASVNVGSTVNLNDGSALLTAGINVSVSDNSSITTSAVFPLGDAEATNSEYGAYPLYFYLEWDWVF